MNGKLINTVVFVRMRLDFKTGDDGFTVALRLPGVVGRFSISHFDRCRQESLRDRWRVPRVAVEIEDRVSWQVNGKVDRSNGGSAYFASSQSDVLDRSLLVLDEPSDQREQTSLG